MPSFQWSQVNQTNPSPYDQIFILSEAVINDSFKNMFPQPVAFSRQDKEALQTRRTGQWISSGQVGPPSVRMHVEERSPAFMMWFTLEFTGGKIHLRTTAPWESPARYNNFDLTGWKLVFKTRIASKVLNSSDPKLNAYRSINGFRDSVFELAQLYLDTSDVGAGAGFDASRSSFSGTSLDSKTLDNLKLFVNEWLTTADERGLNVIGYRLRRKTDEMDAHVRKLVGTFAPSIIDYAPYAWIDPSRPTVETDGLRQNALAMLTYTESSRRSNYERPGLAHSGAFTDGGAAFCMNRDLFWNHFLLNLLKEINQKTEVVPQKSRNLNFEIRYLLGKNPKHRDANDRYFGWKQQTKDGQPHWVWKGDAQKHADKWGNRREKWYKYAQEARSSTELSFRAGGGNIDVKGQVVYDAHVTQFGHPWNMTFHSITEWKLKFRIEAVRGGGIQIVRVGQPTTKAKTVKTTNHGFHDRLGRVSTQGLRNLEKGLANLLNKGLQRITNQLARDLQNLHKLFLPGGGVFRFGTPQFNKRGDILAPMHYLNISAPTGNFVVKRAVRDPSDKTQDTDPSVQEDDLEVQFERIALMPESEEYLEDVPVFDDDNMHHHIELEYEEEEEPYIFLDLSDLNGDELANSDDFWPGPGPGPLAGVDWDRIDRTERPWHEEGDDEDPTDEYPTDEYPTKQPDKKSPKVSPGNETPKTEVAVEIPIDEADLPPDLGGPLDG